MTMHPLRATSGLLLSLLSCALPAAAQDTTVVRADNAPVWRDARLVEELRLGVLEGDDRYIFGNVSRVLPAPDGSVWVVDAQGPRVRIYDREGRWVRDVFRTGAGPGEIASVMGIEVTPDGRIAVFDLRNNRISLYRPDGEYIGMVPATSGSWTGEDFQVDRQGRFWVFTPVLNPACMRAITMPDGTTRELRTEGPGCARAAFVRLTVGPALDVTHTDTVHIPFPERTERVPSFVIMLPEGNVEPFVPDVSYALSPLGYLATAHSSRYAIDLHLPDGVRRIVRDHSPVRIAPGERAEWQGRADFYTRRNPNSASAGVQIPDVKPSLRGIDVDRDGRIWVNRYVAAEKRADVPPRNDPERPPALTWREPPTFDVIEPSGRFLGTITVPRNTRLLWRSGNTFWGVTRGEFDENYVVRYRITDTGR